MKVIDFSTKNIRLWARLGPSGAFGLAALELPSIDENAVVLTADVCIYSGLERFRATYPERLYNIGIAEQNMVGIAGGMAREGLVPFATTYASFAAMRSADQVKVAMGYMGLNVKLAGFGAGFGAGILGPTHMALEDVAVMRPIPNFTIFSPADCASIVKAVHAAAKINGPVYLRLTGSMNCPIVYSCDFEFIPGKAIRLREGKDICFIACGSMVYYAMKAAEKLEAEALSAEVWDMHTIKPLDMEAIEKNLDKKLIVSVEEHSIMGGLGSAIAEKLASMKKRPPHLLIGANYSEYPHAGDYSYLLEKSGLSSEGIAARTWQLYRELY